MYSTGHTCHIGPATHAGALPSNFHSGFFCSRRSLTSRRPARPPMRPSAGRASSSCRARGSHDPSLMKRRKLDLKAAFESSSSHFSFNHSNQAPSSE